MCQALFSLSLCSGICHLFRHTPQSPKQSLYPVGAFKMFLSAISTNGPQWKKTNPQRGQAETNTLDIPWVVPPPRMPVTTRIITFLVGDPNLNLHLPLASWEGVQPKIYPPTQDADSSSPRGWHDIFSFGNLKYYTYFATITGWGGYLEDHPS